MEHDRRNFNPHYKIITANIFLNHNLIPCQIRSASWLSERYMCPVILIIQLQQNIQTYFINPKKVGYYLMMSETTHLFIIQNEISSFFSSNSPLFVPFRMVKQTIGPVPVKAQSLSKKPYGRVMKEDKFYFPFLGKSWKKTDRRKEQNQPSQRNNIFSYSSSFFPFPFCSRRLVSIGIRSPHFFSFILRCITFVNVVTL